MVTAGVGGGTSPSRNGRGSGHSSAGEAATDRRRTRTSAVRSILLKWSWPALEAGRPRPATAAGVAIRAPARQPPTVGGRGRPQSEAFFSNGHGRRWRRDVPVPQRPREWPFERRRGSHRPSADEDVRSPKHSSQMVMAGVGGGTSPSRNGRGSGHSRAGEAATDRRRTRTSAILSFFSQMVMAGAGGGTSPRSGAFFSNGHGRRWRRDVPVPLRPRKWPLERRRDSHRPSADEDVRDPGTR